MKVEPKKKVKKRGYKKRPKNKQELSSFSGTTRKKKAAPVEKKPKVNFEFQDMEGNKYNTSQGRLKIDQDGGVSFLMKVEDSWKTLKGHLITIKMNK